MEILSILRNPLVLAALAGILTMIVMKLDCAVCNGSERKTNASSYCKNTIFVSLLVGGFAYFLQAVGPMVGGGEDFNLGEPDF